MGIWEISPGGGWGRPQETAMEGAPAGGESRRWGVADSGGWSSPTSSHPCGVSSNSREKRLRTRPGHVRFFKSYREGRVRDASAAVSPSRSRPSSGFRSCQTRYMGGIISFTNLQMPRYG
eukprot:gene8430-biopygen13671